MDDIPSIMNVLYRWVDFNFTGIQLPVLEHSYYQRNYPIIHKECGILKGSAMFIRDYKLEWPPHHSVKFSCSVVSNSLWPHGPQHARPSCLITISWSLLKLMSIESVMPSNHLILCHPLLLLPSIFPSIRGFSNESTLHIRWPKYWSLSFNINPSNEYSGLISFRMDWLDLLAIQGTLKSLLQPHSSKASILRCSAFFIVQLPHPCMTTGIITGHLCPNTAVCC